MALSQKDRARAWSYFESLFGGQVRCVFCLSTGDSDGTRLTLDHITPQVVGGSDEIWNLQPLCTQCHTLRNMLHALRGIAGYEAVRDVGLRARDNNEITLVDVTNLLQGS